MKIWQVVLIINAMSFVLARIFWRLTGRLSAKLEASWTKRPGRVIRGEVFVLSPGNLAQPEKAFRFLFPRLRGKRCIYLKFKMIGWSPRSTVNSVLKAVAEADKVTVFSISLGDHIARGLEGLMIQRELNICAINPCPSRRALKIQWRWLLTIFGPVFWLLSHAIGWLSIIPFIPGTGGKYSLMLLADQYMVLVYNRAPKYCVRTKWLVLSEKDELLDNGYLSYLYKRARIAWTPTGHADTVGKSSVFSCVVAGLMRTAKQGGDADE